MRNGVRSADPFGRRHALRALASIGGCAQYPLVRAAARETRLPLAAIGGITLDRAPEVLAAAGRPVMIAVCSAILQAEDLEASTRAFKNAIRLEPPR